MIDYNYEFQYKEFENKPREYRVPIKIRIENKQYKQQQLEFIRKLYPNKLSKRLDDWKDVDVI